MITVRSELTAYIDPPCGFEIQVQKSVDLDMCWIFQASQL